MSFMSYFGVFWMIFLCLVWFCSLNQLFVNWTADERMGVWGILVSGCVYIVYMKAINVKKVATRLDPSTCSDVKIFWSWIQWKSSEHLFSIVDHSRWPTFRETDVLTATEKNILSLFEIKSKMIWMFHINEYWKCLFARL